MWEILLLSGVGWIIGITGLLFAIKTKKDFNELKLMLRNSIEIIGNLEKKLDTIQQSKTISTQPSLAPVPKQEISKEALENLTGTDWDKKKWIQTDPVKEVINYGIEQFGKAVIDDLLGIDEDDFEFECPMCGTPLYGDEVKCPCTVYLQAKDDEKYSSKRNIH
jgi:hypothetical protein